MFIDKLGKEILKGHTVVYPARPGGKGPLQLVKAKVEDVEPALGEITVVPEGDTKPLRITRYDRVAVVA